MSEVGGQLPSVDVPESISVNSMRQCSFLREMMDVCGEDAVQDYVKGLGASAVSNMESAHQSAGVTVRAEPKAERVAEAAPTNMAEAKSKKASAVGRAAAVTEPEAAHASVREHAVGKPKESEPKRPPVDEGTAKAARSAGREASVAPKLMPKSDGSKPEAIAVPRLERAPRLDHSQDSSVARIDYRALIKPIQAQAVVAHEAAEPPASVLQMLAAKAAAVILPMFVQAAGAEEEGARVKDEAEAASIDVQTSLAAEPADQVAPLSAEAPASVAALLEVLVAVPVQAEDSGFSEPLQLNNRPTESPEQGLSGTAKAAGSEIVLPPPFSERLAMVVAETVPSEQQQAAQVLVAKVYELAEEWLEPPGEATVDLTLFETGLDGASTDMKTVSTVEPLLMLAAEQPPQYAELVRAVTLLLQELGMAEPALEQIERMILLVSQELRMTVSDHSQQEPFVDVLHEQIQGMVILRGCLPLLSVRLLQLLGRLGLVQNPAAEGASTL
ncbi:MAG TPA: hypothetical protein VLF69_04965 [Candidatus Saccharimonadales bacterium]|nr:hypothetical protein [Candidatus Saccharimonadales bacterium]